MTWSGSSKTSCNHRSWDLEHHDAGGLPRRVPVPRVGGEVVTTFSPPTLGIGIMHCEPFLQEGLVFCGLRRDSNTFHRNPRASPFHQFVNWIIQLDRLLKNWIIQWTSDQQKRARGAVRIEADEDQYSLTKSLFSLSWWYYIVHKSVCRAGEPFSMNSNTKDALAISRDSSCPLHILSPPYTWPSINVVDTLIITPRKAKQHDG